MTEDFWEGAEILTYTRRQALEDGVLVDVSQLAGEAGFRVPVAITAGVHALLSDIPHGSGEDYTGRLWDVLSLARFAAMGAPTTDRLEYRVIVHSSARPDVKTLALAIGPGDDFEPVMTIMLPGED